MKKRAFSGLLHLLFIILILGCQGEPPVIYKTDWEVNLKYDIRTKKSIEELAILLEVYDTDGSNDLEKLVLYHNGANIFWTLTPSEWILTKKAAVFTIGTVSIQPPHKTTVPRGVYRIRLYDLSGEFAESRFLMNGADTALFADIPEPEWRGGNNLELAPGFDLYTVMGFNNARNLVLTKENQNRLVPLATDLAENEIFNFSVLLQKNGQKSGVLQVSIPLPSSD